jgi:hypothetical protein
VDRVHGSCGPQSGGNLWVLGGPRAAMIERLAGVWPCVHSGGGILIASWGKEGEDDGEPHQGLQRLPWQQRWPGDDEEQAVAVELVCDAFGVWGGKTKGDTSCGGERRC